MIKYPEKQKDMHLLSMKMKKICTVSYRLLFFSIALIFIPTIDNCEPLIITVLSIKVI